MFLDNIDTKSVLDTIRECISACNVYLRDCDATKLNANLLLNIAKYITGILKIFGIKTAEEIGFPVCDGSSSNDVTSAYFFHFVLILILLLYTSYQGIHLIFCNL